MTYHLILTLFSKQYHPLLNKPELECFFKCLFDFNLCFSKKQKKERISLKISFFIYSTIWLFSIDLIRIYFFFMSRSLIMCMSIYIFNQNSTAYIYISIQVFDWVKVLFYSMIKTRVYMYVSSLSTFWVGQSTYSTLSIFCIISLSLSLSWKEKNENDCWCCAAANFNFFLLIIISIPMYVPWKHLSYVIHLHFDLLYMFFKETKKESAKAIMRIHIPFPFIWASYCHNTWRDSFSIVVFFSFFIRCDADISLWELIIIYTIERRNVGLVSLSSIVIQYWFTIFYSNR